MLDSEQTRVWHVLVVDDDQGRRAIALDAVTFSLGRDPSNSIMLNSSAVSRQHAILLRVPKPDGRIVYRLMDGNSEGRPSMNGFLINGRKTAAQDLRDGDEILFGGKVKAQYCIRELTDAQFSQYLESVSYRSVKAEVSDPRRTMAEETANVRQAIHQDPQAIPLTPQAPPSEPELTPTARQARKPKGSWFSSVWRWVKGLLTD